MLLWLHYSMADFICYPHGQNSDMNSNEEWRLNLNKPEKGQKCQALDNKKYLNLMDVYDQNKILKREK